VCSFGGSLSFSPALTSAGSTSTKKEITTVTAHLGSCVGGTPAASATSVTVKPIKLKTTPKGSAGGTCASFAGGASKVTIKAKVNWVGEKPSKFSVVGLTVVVNTGTPTPAQAGELGFTGNFPVSGSYAGSGHLTVYLTQASSNQIATCSGSVSTLSIDQVSSSGTL